MFRYKNYVEQSYTSLLFLYKFDMCFVVSNELVDQYKNYSFQFFSAFKLLIVI